MTKVDIIIPIYNAYDDLKLCVDSLFAHTDLSSNRLILINDNSSDQNIRPYLDGLVKPNIVVIHNEKNLGFSNNINLGMAQSSDRDVILLNSDTIVTSRWVEKITACAYSDDSIGTVTPLSNNATLCSVPSFCDENTLPDGMTVDMAAEIVEKCSLREYPRITVANGFCMFIKRAVINEIGVFDAETFGRGYGEENDFCNRAEQMGYCHVMCDDTYIYHSGTKSFMSSEKLAYIQEHDKILNKRYPVQMHNNAVHCRDNPNGHISSNVGFHFDIWNGKQNVLYLLQSDFRDGADDNIGGTQLHVKQLTHALRNYKNVFVAARDKNFLQLTAYTDQSEYVFRFFVGAASPFPVFRDRTFSELFAKILSGFSIDLVHVHHTINTSLDIFYEAKKQGIPVIFTAHDFYSVCPNTKLLNQKCECCYGQNNLRCEECLNERIGIYEKNTFLKKWREEYEKVLDICAKIIVPSKSTKEILSSYYPKLFDKVTVVEHGMDKTDLEFVENAVPADNLDWKITGVESVENNSTCVTGTAFFEDEPDALRHITILAEDKSGHKVILPTNFGPIDGTIFDVNDFRCYIPELPAFDDELNLSLIVRRDGKNYVDDKKIKIRRKAYTSTSKSFRVAFIGGINAEKGGQIISEVIKHGPDDVEWYVFGGIGEERLAGLKKRNLLKTGCYHDGEVASFLNNYYIDAVCLLSKWPETFSYTLSEAIINNIPVIVTDIGALTDRVKEIGCGEIVSVNHDSAPYEVIDVINRWKSMPKDYLESKENAMKYEHPSVKDMALKYQRLYDGFKRRDICGDITSDLNAFLLRSCISIGQNRYNEAYFSEKMYALQTKLDVIENSVTYKIVRRITGANIPFKNHIKKILGK